MTTLGLDTSNYTTSVATFDGIDGFSEGRLLDVPTGGRGLRQSDALFQHVKHLAGRFSALEAQNALKEIQAIGVSTRPRAVEGSYMPCFLAGESQGRCLAMTLGVPLIEVSHQQGHLAAAAWSAGCMELLDQPFLAWHLSGGTTELLYVEPEGYNVRCEAIGGTSDISAGQLIDRTGVLLGLNFPAGRHLDELAGEGELLKKPFHIKINDLSFSLSGMENQVQKKLSQGERPEDIAIFCLDVVSDVVLRTTRLAQERYPNLPILFSGGVASNRRLRRRMAPLNPYFAAPKYSTDNAMGVAILAHRAIISQPK